MEKTRTLPVQGGHSVQFFAGWGNHLFYQLADGVLWGVGKNDTGQLSIGRKDVDAHYKILEPTEVTFFTPNSEREIVSASTGVSHTLFLTRGHGAWSSGKGHKGQLSDTTKKSKALAGRVVLESEVGEVCDVVAGYNSSYFLLRKGFVCSAGDNYQGQLGLGNRTSVATAQMIPHLEGITQIVTGGEWVMFLSRRNRSSRIFACGRNKKGQLGIKSKIRETIPVEVTFFGKDGILVDRLVSSRRTSYFITSDKQVYCCGRSLYGEYGNGSRVPRNFKPVLSKPLSNFDVFCTGNTANFVVIRKDGKFYGNGQMSGMFGYVDNRGEQCRRVRSPVEIKKSLFRLKGKDISAIVTSSDRTYIISSDGNVFAAGEGRNGELMNGRGESSNDFIWAGSLDLRKRRSSPRTSSSSSHSSSSGPTTIPPTTAKQDMKQKGDENTPKLTFPGEVTKVLVLPPTLTNERPALRETPLAEESSVRKGKSAKRGPVFARANPSKYEMEHRKPKPKPPVPTQPKGPPPKIRTKRSVSSGAKQLKFKSKPTVPSREKRSVRKKMQGSGKKKLIPAAALLTNREPARNNSKEKERISHGPFMKTNAKSTNPISEGGDLPKAPRSPSQQLYSHFIKDGKRICLGKGSFGSVWKVNMKVPKWGLKFGTTVALKVVDLDVMTNRKRSDLIQLQKRIEFEIECLSKMKGHKNIIRYFGGECKGNKYKIFMEFATEGTIDEYFKQLEPHCVQEYCIKFFGRCLEGLAYCHEHNIFHRDIKPQNIMMTKVEPKIADFGVSRQANKDHAMSTLTKGVGTSYYLAPEMKKLGDTLDASDIDYKKVDVYALGMTFLALVCQKSHYGYTRNKVFSKCLNKKSGWKVNLPEGIKMERLRNLLTSSLEYDPAERMYASDLLKTYFP